MRFLKQTKLQTPESVELEFTLAGIGSRILAVLVDYILWITVLVVFFIVSNVVIFRLSDFLVEWVGTSEQLELWLFAITSFISFTIYIGYFAFFETIWRGQTPGKRFAKIRVIRDDGRPIAATQAVLRSLLRPVDELLYIGFLLIVLTPREKRLGDWIAGTIVIHEERFAQSVDIKLSPTATEFAKWLLQQDVRVSALIPDDFAVVRNYLQRRSQMDRKARQSVSYELATQLKQVIQLDTLPENTTTDLFLEAIYLAYQQQSRSNTP